MERPASQQVQQQEQPLPSFPTLSISDGAPTLEHTPLSDDDDSSSTDSEDDNTLDSPSTPTFKLPALAPQLGTLSLPSPVFAGSFLNLLEPSTSGLAPGPRPSRLRAGSTMSRTSVYTREREPTLAFSRPREMADRRVRRAGREEEAWQAVFPDVPMELGVEDPSEWVEEEWRELGTFLEERGYRVGSDSRSGRSVEATRISDSLPLHLHLVPIDDSSYELDVLEHLSSFAVRSNASSHGITAMVPIVGLVPLSADWTAVLTERWEPVRSVSATEFPMFAKDVAAFLSFLHTNRIAHLSLSLPSLALSPSLASPTTPTLLVPRPPTSTAPRYSLTDFSLAIQADPLAKRPTLITGAGPAPEMSDEVAYEPFAVDRYCLGLLLAGVAKSAGVRGKRVEEIIEALMVREPKERLTVAVALGKLREVYP